MAYKYWLNSGIRRFQKIQKYKQIGNKPREGHIFIDLVNNISYDYNFGLKMKPVLMKMRIDTPKVTYTVMADSANNWIQEGFFNLGKNYFCMVKLQMGLKRSFVFNNHRFDGLVLEYLGNNGQYFQLVNIIETQMKIKKPSSKI